MTQKKSESERLSVLEERLASREISLASRDKEIERRLLDLNHAHDRQDAVQQTYVTREKFDGFEEKVAIRQGQTQTTLAELSGQKKGGENLQKIGMMIVAAAVAAVVGFVSAKVGAAP